MLSILRIFLFFTLGIFFTPYPYSIYIFRPTSKYLSAAYVSLRYHFSSYDESYHCSLIAVKGACAANLETVMNECTVPFAFI